jgi:hypothetical protein
MFFKQKNEYVLSSMAEVLKMPVFEILLTLIIQVDI